MQTIRIRVEFENWKIYLKKRVGQDCDTVKLWCYFSGYSVVRTQTSVAVSSRRLFTPLLTVASHHVTDSIVNFCRCEDQSTSPPTCIACVSSLVCFGECLCGVFASVAEVRDELADCSQCQPHDNRMAETNSSLYCICSLSSNAAGCCLCRRARG